MNRTTLLVATLLLAISLLLPAAGVAADTAHGDPYALVFQGMMVVLVTASAGHWAARRLKQSPVLGELLAGILVGAALYHFGNPAVVILRHADVLSKAESTAMAKNVNWEKAMDSTLAESRMGRGEAEKVRSVALRKDYHDFSTFHRSMLLFSSLGVTLLLFMVGLESSLKGMRKVAGSSMGVALTGVLVPFVLGYLATFLILPLETDPNIPIFIGATLCATSIGITARVFKDMGRLDTGEARIVLAAAVLDDILGLILLAVVTGVVTSGAVELPAIAWICLKAVLFLGFVVLFGSFLMEHTIRTFTSLDPSQVKLVYPFALLMVLAWAADAVGLASIVGAFAAGLIIEESHFGETPSAPGAKGTIESIIAPIEGIFAPVFFVLMGMQVDAGFLADPKALLAGLALTVVAVAGKMAASLSARGGVDRMVVGIGMVPRGEVGLIFAGIGKALGVLDDRVFSVIVSVVFMTTLLTPPLLGWAIRRKERREERAIA